MSLEKFLAMSDGSGEHEPECLSNAMFPVRVAITTVEPACDYCDQPIRAARGDGEQA